MIKKRTKKNNFVKVWNKMFTKTFVARILSLFLVFSLSLLSFTPTTNAYYSDIEVSQNNLWQAAFLDFIINNDTFETAIGPEALGEKSHASVAMPTDGSLPMKYILENLVLSDDSGLCGKLFVEAKLNGSTKYSGPFSTLLNSTTTVFGTWEFRFDMPPETIASHGDSCSAETILSAWRQDTETPEESVFTDTEKINFSFKARMVVLNEIFPRPGGGVAPKNREYIELYNNGNTPVDVLGWKVSDIAGSNEVFYTISTTTGSGKANSLSGSTIIPANGYLLLTMNDSSTLNNSGDTVRLYDDNDVLQDIHAYPSVPEAKSVVRFPDGIGFWIDPEPTPGEANIISIEDLEAAGFNEETIRQILALAEMKNITITSAEEEGNIQKTPDEIAEDLEIPEVLEEVATSTEEILEETSNTTDTEEIEEIVVSENEENTETEVAPETENSEVEVVETDEVATSTEPTLVEGGNEIPEEVVEDAKPDTVIAEEEESVEVPPYKEEEITALESDTEIIEETGEIEEESSVVEEIVAKEEDITPTEEVETPVVDAPVINETE